MKSNVMRYNEHFRVSLRLSRQPQEAMNALLHNLSSYFRLPRTEEASFSRLQCTQASPLFGIRGLQDRGRLCMLPIVYVSARRRRDSTPYNAVIGKLLECLCCPELRVCTVEAEHVLLLACSAQSTEG
jgi:hypothetical protein